MRNLCLLGSTGSIGTQTLDIARNNKDINITALAAGSNVDKIEEQIREFHPDIAVLYDEKKAAELKVRIADLDTKVLSGMDGLIEAAVYEKSDMVLTAMVGMIGIRPTIAAIEAKKDIALANKETLVCAGHIIMPLVRKMGVRLLPVDSEHSAIFQSLNGEDHDKIEKILLTASGGPFRGKTRAELEGMTAQDALKHPNWSMGAKITVDSSTLVNKGLEIMEAAWLFDVDVSKIQVIVHPQSIIHSMVQYVDGGIMAQLGVPDMRLPIQYAIYYPERRPLSAGRVDFFKLSQMTFEEPDMDTFEGLSLALRAAKAGGSMPTVFNAANEKAVAAFLRGEIGFLDITRTIREAMDGHMLIANPTVDEILECEREARKE